MVPAAANIRRPFGPEKAAWRTEEWPAGRTYQPLYPWIINWIVSGSPAATWETTLPLSKFDMVSR